MTDVKTQPDEKKPRLTMDSNLRRLDKILKLAESLNHEDLKYFFARLIATPRNYEAPPAGPKP